MEVKEGYKLTEIGLIPFDWDIVPISSVLENGYSITYGVVQPGKDIEDGVLFIRGGDINRGRINVRNLRRISQSVSKKFSRTILQGGEILVSLVGYPGETAIVPDELSGANIARQVALIKLNAHVNNKYFCYFLLSDLGKQLLLNEMIGSAQQVINLREINNIVVLLPRTNKEQEAIAEALSDVDGYIESLEKLIAKKRKIKQGAMQELITGKKRLKEYHDRSQQIRMGDIGFTFNGLAGKSKEDFEEGNSPYIPFLNILENPIIDTTRFDYVRMGPSETQNKVIAGDLFFNGSSETPEEVGMCSVLFENIPRLYLNSFCFGFRLNHSNKIDPLFLAYLFRSNVGRDYMYQLAQGSTRYNLSKTSLKNLIIAVPSYSEQRQISNILFDMDKELVILNQKLGKLIQLKKGMMQKLLTGKIRLV
ncbi:MAG: restriction endonuclease subunit S [Candidatus Helarchaeota archaeon]